MGINPAALFSFKVLLPTIVLTGGLILTAIDHREKKDNSKERKENIVKDYFWWRVLLTIALGVFAVVDGYKSEEAGITEANQRGQLFEQGKKLNEKDSIISIKQNTIISKDSVINDKNDSIISNGKKLFNAQLKTISTQDELYNQVTGGNSIPLLTVKSEMETEGSDMTWNEKLVIKMSNSGKYPIHNIRVSYDFSFPPEDRHRFIELPYQFLAGNGETIVKEILLDFKQKYVHYNCSFLISWNKFSYEFVFTLLPNPLPPKDPSVIPMNLLPQTVCYKFQGVKYPNVEELKKQISKTLH